MALYAKATPREHIEEIRKEKFLIGSEKAHRILEEFHGTVELLSDELYAKDVHFLMELIQNAEDNEYAEDVDASLEFVITSNDITGTGAPATLLMFNNEIGFSAKNIESICSFAKSTKKGNRKRGYIGEKGIGFKSVFLVTTRPYIFSKGYQIRFNEDPCPQCGLGYAVPEWVEEKPSLSDIQKVYGASSTLPATILVLPLKPDKVHCVKQEISSIHPENLLFLSKIKRLSVREHSEDPRLNTVSAIAISSEIECKTRKNIDAESYTLELSANGDQFDKECRYHMWRQKFPVKQENKSKRRMDMEELVITLAFPNGQRVQRGTASPGIYAFLPTEMVTNFPFIIQADFLLSSSRETIRLDEKWNQGILDCVPSAFVDALVTLVTMTDAGAPVSSLLWMFCFLPVNNSPYPELNAVRESIRAKLVEKDIIPSESGMDQNFFYKPCEVGRLMPHFWDILVRAKEENVSLKNLSHHGVKVLNSSFDKAQYDPVLNFLGVGQVNCEWYSKCIQSSNLVFGVSEDVYLELLLFLAENWSSFSSSNIGKIPLLKYVDLDGNVALCSIDASAQSHRRLCLSPKQSWLIDWNKEFRCVANRFFMPMSTFDAVRSSSKKDVILKWLKDQVKVVIMTVNEYAAVLIDHLNYDRKLSVAYAHFLYHSFSKKYLSSEEVNYLCGLMPLVDNYGAVKTSRHGVLVPANESKWAELIVSNRWSQEGYVELGEDYLHSGIYAGQTTPGKQFMDFLKTHVAASDIPDISPPNAGIPAVSSPLTEQNAFLLLDWIKNLKSKGTHIPQKFLTCIMEGNWLNITMNGYSGYRPPSQSFFPHSSWGEILQNGSVIVDIPLVNKSFYGESINKYKEELKTIGVMFEFAQACEFIGKHLMSLSASSNVTRDNVFSILNFIRFLRGKCLPPDSFIQSIKDGSWLKTSQGYKTPGRSVLNDHTWKTASQLSDIPFVDESYYGQQILSFKVELQLLGVLVGFNENYQLVIDNLKSLSFFDFLSADAVHLALECLRHSRSSAKLVYALRNTKCLKTNVGFKSPGDCFLCDCEWSCLLEVFNCFPTIDQTFYGNTIVSSKRELQQLGVVVNFQEAVKEFVRHFKQQASSSSITKDHVLLFLSCYRQLKKMSLKFPAELKSCISEEKWVRTRLSDYRFGDYRSPRDCILFDSDWESISPIALLPFIDDSDRCYGKAIHEYKKELKSMGTTVAFEDGVVKFVAEGLRLPSNPSNITPANVLSLLKCIQILQEKKCSLPESFTKQVSKKWLKTHIGDGYSSPNECLLFDNDWESTLKQTDGPFIDEEFYGSDIKSYGRELSLIGVTIDIEKGCSLIACHLDYHTDFATIVRIYNFLAKYNWKPDDEAAARIWIPDGTRSGQWVSPGECVLHDKDGLFSSELKVLDKHYDHKLLSFFSCVFSVKSNPLIDDYCNLWKSWESSGCKLSNAECCAFWHGVLKQCSSKTEKVLAESLVKLPVNLGSNEILLLDKRDVFIADNLQLKDVFEESSPHSLFVWYPQPNLPAFSRAKLLGLYSKIGVRRISESVQKEELSFEEGGELKQVNQKDFPIGKVLVKLILGCLADPSIQLEAEKRHDAVKCLENLTILETAEPITVRYTVTLSSGETVGAKASQMIRWDKESGNLFAQKIDRSGGCKGIIKYATQFAEVISKGVLWDMEDHVNALAELIKLAFLVDFDEEAVEFLMKSKNLQVFSEDEEFLSAAFKNMVLM